MLSSKPVVLLAEAAGVALFLGIIYAFIASMIEDDEFRWQVFALVGLCCLVGGAAYLLHHHIVAW